MKSHARVVVIGGGIVGCSLLYHLTKRGWRDVVLVEKGELTVGSTWHAAGNTPHYTTSYTTGRVFLESTNFYNAFAKETGEEVGFHKCGGIRLAINQDHIEEHKRAIARSHYLGMPIELVGPAEAKRLFPYIETKGVLAVAYTPDDGYIDPSSITNALARQARANGAEVYRHTRVTGMSRENGNWRVETDKGVITCEIVVNSAGLWGREVAAMVGYRPPMVPMERQYLVTEPVPGLKDLGHELPILRDITAPLYIRQERESLLLGLFDKEPVFWAADETPAGFEQELLVPDLERVSHAFEKGLERIPILGELGVKRVINGPLMRTPDANPLIGPVPGIPNYFMNGGYFAGFGLAGGLGGHLAEWIVEGEPAIDLSAFDARRFGDYATAGYTMDATRGAYVHEFSVVYPQEEPHGARNARVSALHDRMTDAGAVFGVRNGWEVPNWFATKGGPSKEKPAFRRADWFATVAAETKSVVARAGVLDLSSLSKFEVSGAGAAAWLDRLSANRLPQEGAIAASPLLSPKGKLAAFVSIARTGRDRFYLTASSLAERHVLDILMRGAPADVAVDDLTEAWGALLVAGPKAREILAAALKEDLSDEKLPRFRTREVTAGIVPARILSLCALGLPGWELHGAAPYLRSIYDAVRAAGEAHGLVDFGMRAHESLRIEAGVPRWGIDYGAATAPAAIGFDRYVKTDKGEFVGSTAKGAQPGSVLVTLKLDEKGPVADADSCGSEPVWDGDTRVGITSSGSYGHRAGARLALAFVERAKAAPGTKLTVELLGERQPATVVATPAVAVG